MGRNCRACAGNFGMGWPSGRRLPWHQYVLLRGGGGGSCTPPAITGYAAAVEQGYRQAWVNWSYSGSPILSPIFWWYLNGNQLSTPDLRSGTNSASINLNDLTPGETYDYTVDVVNGCGSSESSGTLPPAMLRPTNSSDGYLSLCRIHTNLIRSERG